MLLGGMTQKLEFHRIRSGPARVWSMAMIAWSVHRSKTSRESRCLAYVPWPLITEPSEIR